MKIVGEPYEKTLDEIRAAIDTVFRSAPGEMPDVGVMWTFDDVVVIKDWSTGKMYGLPYTRSEAGFQFGEPEEVTLEFVSKRFQALDATPDEIHQILTAPKSQPAELTGPIVMKNEEKQIAYAAVLVPGEPDFDGEAVSAAKVEEVAHKWMESYRNVDVDHSLNNVGIPVETYLTTQSMKVTWNDTELELPVGTWILASKLDDDTWERVQKGELVGYSIMGVPKDEKMKSQKSAELALKKTLLEDLGPDWIVHTVSVVDAPAVPKSKFFCLKAKISEPSLLDKIKATFTGKELAEKEGRKFSKNTLESLHKAYDALAALIKDAESEQKSKQKSIEGLTPDDIAAAVKTGVDNALAVKADKE